MFCTRCGNPAKDHDKKFCTRCGLKYRQIHTSATSVAATKEVAPERKTSLSGRNREFLEALVGRTIDQRYTLESPIGFGAMGAVYRARRINIGDTAAIKILKPEHTTDPNTVERFQREAQVGARLHHPNIVSVYDFGVSEENLVYFAMELIDGENLRTMLMKNGPVSQTVAVEIIGQVCSALEEAHRNGIVHRDLKPENIIVRKQTSGLEVKVLDFGIASFRNMDLNKLTGGSGLMGTPHYMSPEQWLGEEVDHRSDIYSLGLILFEMLSGRPPFPTMIPSEIMAQQAKGSPYSLRAMNPNVSPEIEAAAMHALEKNPASRPQSAEELSRELRAALRGYHPQLFAQQTVVDQAPARRARRRAAAPQKGRSFLQMAVLLTLLGASAAGGGLWWARNNAPASAHTMAEAESLNNQVVIPSPLSNLMTPEPKPSLSPEPVASPAPEDVAAVPTPKPTPTVNSKPTRRSVTPAKKKDEKKSETIKKPAPKNVLSQNDSDDRDRPRFRDEFGGGGRFGGFRSHGYGDGMGWLRERWARERAFRWGYRRGYRNAVESDSKDKDDDKDRSRRRREREDR